MRRTQQLFRCAAAAFLLALGATAARANDCDLQPEDEARFEAEHLVGGQPTAGAILTRRAYVMQYDPENRVPRWVYWHATADYLSKIPRQGPWKRFRTDDDELLAPPVKDDDYLGLQDEFDYARGHMIPYFMSGGDRNGDGQRGTQDFFDACTVFEINYMSNIAPQLHSRFNGSGGLWYKVETRERTKILSQGTEFHVIAGTIFGQDPQRVGPGQDIGVPDMFYRILVTDSGTVPFLFVHRRQLGTSGCGLEATLDECIVTVADIEALTGADFFSALSDAEELALEQSDGAAVWLELISRP